jgi:murein DD-endopeptidase MepM/ murein hydrolase activator NlpD
VLYRRRLKPVRRISRVVLAAAALVLALVLGVAFEGCRALFAPRPQISLGSPFQTVGRNATLVVDVREPRYGVRSLRVVLRQGGGEQVVADQTLQPPQPEAHIRWTPAQEKRFRLSEGAGHLHVEARSGGVAFFSGKTASLDQDFTARLTPPRLEVLTTQHYVNQGGCDMVVYKVTPSAAESGVTIGPAYFKGFPMPGGSDPAVHFAIFCFPYDAAPSTPVRLKARDEASNEALAGFWIRVFPKTFRSRPIELQDDFLNKVVPEIMSQTPSVRDTGDLLQNFLEINRDLRKVNNGALAELAAKSPPEFLWKEPFRQLSNSQVEAAFADHRTYTYKGREVDRQDHLGYDLATTANAPVTAANDGVVALADFFGIYGNTIIIDHGYGLMSLYGHLSSFAVKAGDRVARGQTIAQSGATGLAGGDHLHFSMIYQGQQVDAREWWDPHWIHDRLQAKLQQFGGGGK